MKSLFFLFLFCLQAYAGIDFTGGEQIPPPELKNTEEAWAYGEQIKDSPKHIRGLLVAEREHYRLADIARKEHRWSEAIAEGTKGQLCREALDKVGNHGASVHCYSRRVYGKDKN